MNARGGMISIADTKTFPRNKGTGSSDGFIHFLLMNAGLISNNCAATSSPWGVRGFLPRGILKSGKDLLVLLLHRSDVQKPLYTQS
jgi:hypothetical protein